LTQSINLPIVFFFFPFVKKFNPKISKMISDANQDEKEANIQEQEDQTHGEDQNHGEAQVENHSNQRITRSMARSLGRDCQMKSLFVISLVLNCK